MTNDEIKRCHNQFIETANSLAKDGTHPAHIIEGILCAVLHMNEAALGEGRLVDWLRDAADVIEARALKRSGGLN